MSDDDKKKNSNDPLLIDPYHRKYSADDLLGDIHTHQVKAYARAPGTFSQSQKKFIFDGFLLEDAKVLLLGREKIGRTTLAMQIAVCAAAGVDFLTFKNKHPNGIKTVYIEFDQESEDRLSSAVENMADSLGLTPHQAHNLATNMVLFAGSSSSGLRFPPIPTQHSVRIRDREAEKVEDAEKRVQLARDFWEKFIRRNGVQLLVLDQLRSVHEGSEQDSRAALNVIQSIRDIFDPQCVIMVHQMRKMQYHGATTSIEVDMRQWSDGCRGSGAMKAHADLILGLDLVGAEPDTYHVMGAFGREIEDVGPMGICQTATTGMSAFSIYYWIPSFLTRAAGEVMHITGDRSRAALVKHLESQNFNHRTAYRHVSELLRLKILDEVDGQITISRGYALALGAQTASGAGISWLPPEKRKRDGKGKFIN